MNPFGQFRDSDFVSDFLGNHPPKFIDEQDGWSRVIAIASTVSLLSIISCLLSVVSLQLDLVGVLCGPGFFFGVLVLVPLSRWFCRNWWMTIASIPVSIAAWFCAGLLYVLPAFGRLAGSTGPVEAPVILRFIAVGFGALLIVAWMSNPTNVRSLFAATSALIIAVPACVFLISADDSNSSKGPIAAFMAFQSAIAVCLSARLWNTPKSFAQRRQSTGADREP